MFKVNGKLVAPIAAATLFFGVIQGAQAASACKGLEQSACETSAQCGWVKSYERKDGKQVKAFCRTKSKGNAKALKKANSEKEGQS